MELTQKTNQEALISRLFSDPQLLEHSRHAMERFSSLMAYYRCAMMEIETKFRVLDEEFSLTYDRNPIHNIQTRLKTPGGIREKLERLSLPFTMDNVYENLFDVAGVRVICPFCDDVYLLSNALLKQDDITLYQKKDYIQNPKPNGYRSLHLIVGVPIYLHKTKQIMKVEIQLRTIAMDCWASLEHQLRYKKDPQGADAIDDGLLECARLSARLDEQMNTLKQRMDLPSHQN